MNAFIALIFATGIVTMVAAAFYFVVWLILATSGAVLIWVIVLAVIAVIAIQVYPCVDNSK